MSGPDALAGMAKLGGLGLGTGAVETAMKVPTIKAVETVAVGPAAAGAIDASIGKVGLHSTLEGVAGTSPPLAPIGENPVGAVAPISSDGSRAETSPPAPGTTDVTPVSSPGEKDTTGFAGMGGPDSETPATPGTQPEGGTDTDPSARASTESPASAATGDTAEVAEGPTTGAEASTVSAEAEARTARAAELKDKFDKGELKGDELKEYAKLRRDEADASNKNARREELKSKIEEGTATDDEVSELDRLGSEGTETSTTAEAAEKPLTAEEMKAKEAEDFGTDLLMRIANDPDSVTPEDFAKFSELQRESTARNMGMNETEARNLIRRTRSPELRSKYQRELAGQRAIREQLQRLMTLEMQLIALPQRLEFLRMEQVKTRNEIKARDKITSSRDIKDPKQLRERQHVYALMMKLSSINGEIIRTRNSTRVFVAEYKDTMAYVRRKLGLRHGMGAFLDWAEAKATKVSAGVTNDVRSLSDVAA